MTKAWSYDRVVEEYDALHASNTANAEMKIREIAKQIVDEPKLTLVGRDYVHSIPVVMPRNKGISLEPVLITPRWRDIEVRLIPGMDRNEALYIAEQQLYEQWHVSTGH